MSLWLPFEWAFHRLARLAVNTAPLRAMLRQIKSGSWGAKVNCNLISEVIYIFAFVGLL